ncbi:hypothetical protein AXF42_Ash008738 [Apostasia shenzhenica]|uniref:Uncharacterized protein n=1 Tax=Apostasia shenzhenica TaxID=1088818 RepID=A0A2I0B2A1_9ASPA|nr:hypothetical protein AXF42_Ash008738 [Apostasia shenzhenica]
MLVMEDGYCTPASPSNRIPAAVECPPPPRKKKAHRRKAVGVCSVGRRIEVVGELGLVVFREVRFLRRRRRKTAARGRLTVAR